MQDFNREKEERKIVRQRAMGIIADRLVLPSSKIYEITEDGKMGEEVFSHIFR